MNRYLAGPLRLGLGEVEQAPEPESTAESAGLAQDNVTPETLPPEAELPVLLEAKSFLDSFADEQICNLVRQVFVPGWPKPARQVVFSPVDEQTDITSLCAQIAEVLACEESRTVCVVQAKVSRERTGNGFSKASAPEAASPQESWSQISDNVWRTQCNVVRGEGEGYVSAALLSSWLSELREKFDYVLVRGPAACHGESVLLGRLCDGVILVIEANATRRAAALKAKDRLCAANARFLGTVLTERTFPIPGRLYKRL